MLTLILSLILGVTNPVHADIGPDWSADYILPAGETRANIYEVPEAQLETLRTEGNIHAMKYPVTVTGLLIPYRPLLNFLQADTKNPLKKFLLNISKKFAGFKTETELYEWLGLNKFNGPEATGIYKMPRPLNQSASLYVGAGVQTNASGEGLTFSCFACHSANLFGTTVMGLTNKRSHSNKFFHLARQVVPKIPNLLFQLSTNASAGDMKMFERTKKNLVHYHTLP
jgi:hypothetical protein